MGMAILVDIRDADVDAAPSTLPSTGFASSTRRSARTSTDSDICRLGRGELALADAHPDVAEVLERCEDLRVETGGYFDAHAAGQLDPSGFVKGWSVDRAAASLDAPGRENFAIYAGGDIVVRGRPLPDERWLVGIRHPTSSRPGRGDRRCR